MNALLSRFRSDLQADLGLPASASDKIREIGQVWHGILFMAGITE
jgi:hypothetical protein